MSAELLFTKYNPATVNNTIAPRGSYVSNTYYDTDLFKIPRYIIVKLENGYWATQAYHLPTHNYIPYISNLQTPEVQPNTGWYKTLTDAKNSFKTFKRIR
jgi:hypothetical protein